MKIQVENIDSNNNADRSPIESRRSLNLEYFPCVLKDAIENWGRNLRLKRDHQFMNYYKELAILTNRAESTIRNYTNEFNTTYPTIDVLYSICVVIQDFTPMEYLGELK